MAKYQHEKKNGHERMVLNAEQGYFLPRMLSLLTTLILNMT